MRSLRAICRWEASLSLHWTCHGRSGADYRAALRDGDARLNQPNSVLAFHMEAADGRVSLLVRDGRLKLRNDCRTRTRCEW
jgi:hypothetical protein